ncbi:IS66 family insertion sequence element accessory protein TnpB, partial [Mesorhizobium sp.]|uniref:IS66 family insertion sequence element accessory protein TnpB n=1 Tax=Mesorhizobium sp. TaxID=1871066 RepID=UPI0025FFAF23
MPLKKRVDLSGIRSADFIKASGMNRPHSKAEYMPAPDQPVINVRKPLPRGGRPPHQVTTDRIYLCCGATDMRRGINSLARMVQQVLALDPHTGAIFCFRGCKGNYTTFSIRFASCDDRLSVAPLLWD